MLHHHKDEQHNPLVAIAAKGQRGKVVLLFTWQIFHGTKLESKSIDIMLPMATNVTVVDAKNNCTVINRAFKAR